MKTRSFKISDMEEFNRKSLGNILYCIENGVNPTIISKALKNPIVWNMLFPKIYCRYDAFIAGKKFFRLIVDMGYSVSAILTANPLKLILDSNSNMIGRLLNSPFGRILLPEVYSIIYKIKTDEEVNIVDIFEENDMRYTPTLIRCLQETAKNIDLLDDKEILTRYWNRNKISIGGSKVAVTTHNYNADLSNEFREKVARMALKCSSTEKIISIIKNEADDKGITIATSQGAIVRYINECRKYNKLIGREVEFRQDFDSRMPVDELKKKYGLDFEGYKDVDTIGKLYKELRSRIAYIIEKTSLTKNSDRVYGAPIDIDLNISLDVCLYDTKTYASKEYSRYWEYEVAVLEIIKQLLMDNRMNQMLSSDPSIDRYMREVIRLIEEGKTHDEFGLMTKQDVYIVKKDTDVVIENANSISTNNTTNIDVAMATNISADISTTVEDSKTTSKSLEVDKPAETTTEIRIANSDNTDGLKLLTDILNDKFNPTNYKESDVSLLREIYSLTEAEYVRCLLKEALLKLVYETIK